MKCSRTGTGNGLSAYLSNLMMTVVANQSELFDFAFSRYSLHDCHDCLPYSENVEHEGGDDNKNHCLT